MFTKSPAGIALSSSTAQRILLLKHLSSSKRPMLACEAYSFRGVPLCSVPPDFSYGPPAPKLNSSGDWRIVCVKWPNRASTIRTSNHNFAVL